MKQNYDDEQFASYRLLILQQLKMLTEETKDLRREINKLNNWRWYIIGIATAFGAIINFLLKL